MLIDYTNPFIDWIFPRRCTTCDIDISAGYLCTSCLSLITVPENLLFSSDYPGSLFYFELVIKDIIKVAKFYRNSFNAHVLLYLINQQLSVCRLYPAINQFSPEAIAFVPSHFVNRAMRGGELSLLFAHLIGRKLNCPVLSLLKRRYYKNLQSLRKKRSEREKDIVNSFELNKSKIHLKRLLLVDDITTTGATLNECKRVLRNVAKEIRCITIAKTP